MRILFRGQYRPHMYNILKNIHNLYIHKLAQSSQRLLGNFHGSEALTGKVKDYGYRHTSKFTLYARGQSGRY
jgi:hypothetical protein